MFAARKKQLFLFSINVSAWEQ
ncbi:restriction endonuclease subunit S, partial [Mycoplasma bovis]|nr:restriction endonuclease subunit S [Mycoplasmopsis bovis]